MGKIVVHNLTNDELIEKRQQAFLELNYAQRFQAAVNLMRVSALFNGTVFLKNRNKIIIKN